MNSEDLWTEEQLIFEGDEYYHQALEGIRTAQKSILVECYIFEDDEIGRPLFNELVSARSRNVQVQVIVDGVGSPAWRSHFGAAARDAGIHYHVYHELPLRHLLSTGNFFSYLRLLLRFIDHVNRRDHRKIFVFDDEIALVGSFNISRVHSCKYSGVQAWRDSGVRLRGRGVRLLIDLFALTWLHRDQPIRGLLRRWMRNRRIGFSSQVRSNHTLVLRRLYYRELIQKIRYAKKRVWITNAYFVPDGTLIRALKSTSRLGADVRVLIPQKSDLFFMRAVGSAFYMSLLKSKVRIYEYQPCVLHAKTLIADDWCIVGSSNLNHRSLLHDLEVDITLASDEAKLRLNNQYEIDLQNAKEVTIADYRNRGLGQRFLAWIFFAMRYFL